MGERFTIGKKTPIKRGAVEVGKLQGPDIARRINTTAKHEGAHVAASQKLGVKVIEATDQPGSDYAGYMRHEATTEDNEVIIAAAPAAFNLPGTGEEDPVPGSDRYRVETVYGRDWRAAKSAAFSLLSGKEEREKMDAVATTIQSEGMATGEQMARSSRLVEMGTFVIANILSPEGKPDAQKVAEVSNRAQDVELSVADLPVEREVQE